MQMLTIGLVAYGLIVVIAIGRGVWFDPAQRASLAPLRRRP